MCGITGWVSYERDLRSDPETQSTLDAMTETMACRGPDDRGTRTAPHAALGHRRLAVIGLPGGRQPMTAGTPDGPVTIVYSGETYNFAELRAELASRGHRFATGSDTEVVLRSYLEWGGAFAGKAPYPSTQDPAYGGRVRDAAREYLLSDPGLRMGIERALDVALWLDVYQPVLRIP